VIGGRIAVVSSRPYQWPDVNDKDAWQAVANRTMQREMLAAARQGSAYWDEVMRELIRERLDYEPFTERRLSAVRERVRQRKLIQTNIRYRFGFKDRPAYLVRRDMMAAMRLDADSNPPATLMRHRMGIEWTRRTCGGCRW
jgi:hypothetical protein